MATAPERPGAERYVPDTLDLTVLRDAAGGCEGCELYRDATQTVFGSGPPDASMMLIGEQPGDMEDRNGVPFIGPAGRLLRSAMEASGIDVERVYLTNAVKHFRWKATAQGNRRIHQKPAAGNITACRPWSQAELRSVQPAVVVALGATAAQAILGPKFALTQFRGLPLSWPGTFGVETDAQLFATVHPSAILRAPDREEGFAGLVRDLQVAVAALPR